MGPRTWEGSGGASAELRGVACDFWETEVTDAAGRVVHRCAWPSEGLAVSALMMYEPGSPWRETTSWKPLMVTVADAAKELGLDAKTLYKEHDAGRLEFTRIRGCTKGYRIRRDELERWAEQELVPA